MLGLLPVITAGAEPDVFDRDRVLRTHWLTTHYSAAELTRLIEAANSVCDRNDNKPELVVLRRLKPS